MKRIPLGNEEYALVDDEDYERLRTYSWTISSKAWENCRYATTKIGRMNVKMHRMILGVEPSVNVDHKNRDGLDNRKSNLRIATYSQNGANRPKQLNNKSGYKGVSWHESNGKWRATICVMGRSIHLGNFSDKEDAALAYNRAALTYFGEFARTNDEVPRSPSRPDNQGPVAIAGAERG